MVTTIVGILRSLVASTSRCGEGISSPTVLVWVGAKYTYTNTLPHLLVLATSERFLPAWAIFRVLLVSESMVTIIVGILRSVVASTSRCGEGISSPTILVWVGVKYE
jgi:hypothetical protein